MTKHRAPKEIVKFINTVPKGFKPAKGTTVLELTLKDVSSGLFYFLYVDRKSTTIKKYGNKAPFIPSVLKLSSKAKRLRNRHKKHYPELFI
jgi:hypothetical protein